MNNFKYKRKTKLSEETMNSFKNFDEVIQKHKNISSAYKSVWKYSIITSVLAGSICLALIFYPQDKKNKIENSSIEFTENSNEINNTLSPDKKPIDNKKIVSTQKSKIKPKEKESKEKSISTVKKESSKNIESEKKELKTETVFLKEKDQNEPWYTLNEKPDNEIIKLPTLFVSKKAWPKKIDKYKLIKSPNITAVYQNINREIPIVNGTVYITFKNATEKPKGYKISGNVFPPELIREIHKTTSAFVLLLKDIEMFIPGRGRINIGDRIIEINNDSTYSNRF